MKTSKAFQIWTQYVENKWEENGSDFIWDFGKLPFPSHLGKYIVKKWENKY